MGKKDHAREFQLRRTMDVTDPFVPGDWISHSDFPQTRFLVIGISTDDNIMMLSYTEDDEAWEIKVIVSDTWKRIDCVIAGLSNGTAP